MLKGKSKIQFGLKREEVKVTEEETKQADKKAHSSKGKAAVIRLQKDFSGTREIFEGTAEITFPEEDNLLKFIYTARPQAGFWKGGIFRFEFTIPTEYPIESPKVRSLDKIYHPNIDPKGGVCSDTLRKDWNPTASIAKVFLAINFLFTEPNALDPLNLVAATDLRNSKESFATNVLRSLQGQKVGEETFPINPGFDPSKAHVSELDSSADAKGLVMRL